ncbi:serine--tRNA ligase [Porphyromonas circumdentaria]|uniref:Serine--tRNA ligase n=1 Tax=Porphyromonas circumdentaria TaxID=29524 RepID=A0A1T4MHN5_9PORP|nr:serine--tRNA ligase [Porphyromonas circumdentaria]MBB6275753.1 seryl-tRNA synthetase [Porphyromonas circumdentaria]SJZ66284.1 seryl-tRNA synthetase [Porphyromonas circumdentaria]
MLTIKNIVESPEEIIKRLAIKHFNAREVVAQVIALDSERKRAQQAKDTLLSEQKIRAKQIGDLMKMGAKEQAETLRLEVAELKEQSKKEEEKEREVELSLRELLLTIPNTPHESVPEGNGAEDNVCIKTGGMLPNLEGENKLPHWDLAQKYNLIDFELGVKITGAGFPVYKGKGARLQRALINFFLDKAIEAGFVEVEPPYVVNEDSGYGTGQLPDKEGQMYFAPADNLYLIPTAEVPVTNMYRGVILEESELPIKNVAYSACFRREAGSYGKDVRGLNRLHQFNKVEIVCIDTPEHSYQTLQTMVDYVEGLVTALGLPWRILRLCGGDISFTSALTFDFEVFSAAQERWLEVSSVSNFESFQANRLKCRYRKDKGTQLCHTLNGSALALPRIVATILENYQTPEGIVVPEVLHPYTGFDIIR